MRGTILWLGFMGLLGVGGAVAAPFLMGQAAELKVGECFDVPSAAVEEVGEVQHHPCSDAHTAEVVHVGRIDGAGDAPYPSESQMDGTVLEACDAAFGAYTGLDAMTDPVWTYGWFVPTADGWADGDRGYSCHAIRIDGAATTGSLRSGD